jgi:DNA-binding LytR/AlgR family response regulator
MPDFLFFKVEKTYLKIRFTDILYIHAEKRYVTIVTSAHSYFSTISIGEIERHLPPDLFRRIHRSYIISLYHTDKFDSELAYVGGRKIPIAEQYKNVLKTDITVINGTFPTNNLHNEATKLMSDLNR